MSKILVKERKKDSFGRWVEEYKPLDDSKDAVVLKSLILESEDESKRIVIKLDNDGVLKLIDDGIEYRILVCGITSQSGEVVFKDSKVMRVNFAKPFLKRPSVVLTLGDPGNAPAYRVDVSKTSFTIRFQSNFSGLVQWQATEA